MALEKSGHPLGPSVLVSGLGSRLLQSSVRHGEGISAMEKQILAKARVRSPHRQPSCACRAFQAHPLALQNGFALPSRHSVCAQMKDKLLLRIRAVRVTLQVDFAATAADAFLSL